MLNAYRVIFIFQVRKNFCPSESVIFSLLNQTQKQVAKKLHKYAIQSFQTGQLVSWSVFFHTIAFLLIQLSFEKIRRVFRFTNLSLS